MRIVFIGTGEIGVPTLAALQKSEHELVGAVTQPDKPVGRDQHIEAPPIKQALAGTGLSIMQPERIKASIEQIRRLNPEVIVVMAYGQLLPPDLLKVPRFGCLNLHASLLPRWRGAAPIQAAIAAGDRESGITVMYMEEGLDTGDILLQRKIDISPGDTGQSLHDRLAQVAPETLLESLRLLSSGDAPRLRQDDSLATYAPKLNREAGKIDWFQPAELIERKIRAFNPWPGVFTTLSAGSGKPRNLKIYAATIVDLTGSPGQILHRDEQGLVIAAGHRALSLGEIQLEGKRRMSAREFVRGFVASTSCG